MTIKYADRVFETSTTQGTGTLNLAGAATGYQSFIDAVATGSKVPYCIKDGTNWEVGIGTVTDGDPDTLSRDSILASSNSDNAVDWGAGTRDVFLAASNVLQFLRDENLNDVNQIAVSSAGTGNAQEATPLVTPLDFSDGMMVRWRAPASNTGAVTLDWGGLGAKSYVNNDFSAFTSGQIVEDTIQEAIYNLAEDRFERTSPIYPATPTAAQVSYDNGASGLTATDVQDALDEIAANGFITLSKINAASVVTESEGISSNDNDTTFPTSAAVKDYVDSNSGLVAYVAFTGTGTPSITRSKNISSLTDLGTGSYRPNFTANVTTGYAVTVGFEADDTTTSTARACYPVSRLTGSFILECNAGTAATDYPYVAAAVFGALA